MSGRRQSVGESPWCSRAEAASYLGFEDVESVDARLTRGEKAEAGRIRFRVMEGGGRRKVRLWRADVRRILREFED